MSKRAERLQIVQGLVNAGYGYLNYDPWASEISGNFMKFSNQFMSLLLSVVTYDPDFEGYFKTDQANGLIYEQFKKVYQSCAIRYQQMQRKLEEQQLLAQQAYMTNQYQQQGYGNQYNQQQQGPYNQHQYHQQQQNYQQGGINFSGQQSTQDGQNFSQVQSDSQQGQQQNYQQGGYNNNRRNYENNNQNGGYNKHRQYNNNQGGYNNQGRNNYPHGNQNQGGYVDQGPKKNYQNKPYNNRDGQGNNYNNQGHGNNKPNYQNKNVHNNQAYEYEQKAPQVVVRPRTPSPPPKPQPKNMKFSMDQIKEFIDTFQGDKTEEVNDDLAKKVQEVKEWRKAEISFTEKVEKTNMPKFDKKQSSRDNRGDGGYNKNNSQGFNKGANYKPSEDPAMQPKKEAGLKIVVGKNQTLETKMIKNEIKGRAGLDFATLMEKENMGLDEITKAKKEIIYNLNLLAPENLNSIKTDLLPFLGEDSKVCQVLIEQIIEKAWDQPKYASTYAGLCSYFSKIAVDQFKFATKKDAKSSNPFKLFLISNVQHSFDKKEQTIPEFNDSEQKQAYFKSTKKKILGNVKFIAELIRSKVLKKRILKICISQLVFTFLSKYYNFRKTAKIVDSYYDYYFEAVIEFIENVGQVYDKMDEPTQKYEPAQKAIIDLIEMKIPPPEEQIAEIGDIGPNEYFKVFEIIDQRVLKKVNKRLSALLLNLVERREHNWQKHLAEAEGPKKLKEIKSDLAKEEQEMNTVKSQKKANLERLNDLVKTLFKSWETDSKTEKQQVKTILKEYSRSEFYLAYLSQLADEKKDKVSKRVSLFDVVILDFYNVKDFIDAWIQTIKGMAFSSSDFPFCGSALALTLLIIKDKEGLKLEKFYLKTDDQDEQWFMNEVFEKFYFYTEWDEIKKFVEIGKKKPGNMLEKPVPKEE